MLERKFPDFLCSEVWKCIISSITVLLGPSNVSNVDRVIAGYDLKSNLIRMNSHRDDFVNATLTPASGQINMTH